jgi:AP-4 complex subunit epsilon-1
VPKRPPGECKSKTDEDAIVAREVEVLKKRLADPALDKSRMQEYLLRVVYVEMLGHSASFGYIHAVKMTHEPHITSKKVGYLATSLFLDDSHDLLILIVNTLQQDLKSDNPLVGAARRPAGAAWPRPLADARAGTAASPRAQWRRR